MGYAQDQLVAERDARGRFIKGHSVYPGTETTRFKKGMMSWCAGKTREDDTRIAQPWLGKKRPELKNTRAAMTMFIMRNPRRINVVGYVEIYDKQSRHSCVLEHRYLMEDFLKRKLLPGEQIHHKNGIKTDNELSNLEVIDIHDHGRIHGGQKK